MGFRNIRERLESDGGTFELKTKKSGGTKLDIFYPTSKNKQMDRAA